jgi:Holliday junction resolvase RusA-like endonuclease
MADALVFDVPWVALVSDNRKYVKGYILSSEYREAKTLIAQFAIAAARRAGWERMECRIGIDIDVRYPDRRRRDLNFQKAFLDGITASEAVWVNDSQIREINWRFDDITGPCKKSAGASITIRTLPQPER